jgi:hypothetical protein
LELAESVQLLERLELATTELHHVVELFMVWAVAVVLVNLLVVD